MNYIPGFSNYLEASVPEYGAEPIMDAPQRAMVAPTTQEVVTPMSYEDREARRIAANTPPRGTSIVGPYAGKKGLSFGDDNTFDIYDEQEVRVVDGKGNVIFTGTGAEGAKQAVAVGQSLSNDLGKNANFKIQKGERTINPDGSVGGNRYIDVAYAAPSQSGLGFLADNVLPFAAAFIPGVGPVLGAALGSAASSAAQGRGLQDTLTRAALAGGAAYAGGQLFGPASPGASASTGGVNADLVPNALKGLNFGSLPSASIPAGVGGDIVAMAAKKAASNLVGSTAGSVLGQAALSQVGAPNQNRVVDGVDQETGDIVVSRRPEPLQLTQDTAGLGSALAGLPALGGLASDPNLVNYDEPYASDIVVTGNVPTVTQDVGLGSALAGLPAVLGALPADPALAVETPPKKKLGLEEYLRLGGKAVGLLGNLAGGAGAGAGQAGTYNSGGGRLNPIFSAKLPSAGGLGTIGATRTARPMGDEDWLTYGTRPERSFFDYSTQPANPAPITTPIPEEPRGPSMYVPEDNRFAKGGRTEFAVNGPGTGRSDDIPAVLSDGEYVIDAETVALLGDGSSKAGAKKLDELRVKVRKHKGKKLAKGRFSANAKKPEAYLSGGRV